MYNSKTDQIVAPLARYLQITINFNSAQPQGTVKFLKNVLLTWKRTPLIQLELFFRKKGWAKIGWDEYIFMPKSYKFKNFDVW